MQEDHHWPVSGHVVVNRDHVQTVLPQGFQNRRNFVFEHRDIARNRRVLLRTHERRPRIEPHARVDHGAVLLHAQVVSSHGDLVNRPRLLAIVACDLGELDRVERCAAGARRSSRFGFYVTNQIERWFYSAREVCCFAHAVDVHEIDVRVVPEEVVMERSHIDSVVEQGGENRIYLFLQQYQVAHYHIRTIRRFSQGNPTSEAERSRRGEALNRHLQIVARNIYLENACFEVTLTVQRFENLLIITRHVLRESFYAG